MTRYIAALAVAAATLAAPGCAGATSAACMSWADYSGEPDLRRDAQAIVIVDQVMDAGLARIGDANADAYDVVIRSVEKGDLEVGETIRVVATADGCGPERYPEGDPFERLEPPLRLYLVPEGDVWRTLTPLDGVEPA
ncbi:hypothetical protein [Desertivibrio insolitus]|uniref:hypothetical protein n=1 Tax=Herbiconiux sp. SYSU D00978 TaxID=2812562 RepID=UPI001A95A942|nr:hypothetical protein [Herbiconiux sp. SYSU D00978]